MNKIMSSTKEETFLKCFYNPNESNLMLDKNKNKNKNICIPMFILN
jgi:hypothetical protein